MVLQCNMLKFIPMRQAVNSVIKAVKLSSMVGNNFMATPTVTVTQGKLKGAVQESCDGSTYYSFKGVPYAEPPVGQQRFKAPLQKKPWSGVYEAINHGPVCPQVNLFTMNVVAGSEDCLFLNIYTKSLDSNSRQPVIVFIHGGSFMMGSGNSDIYGPEFLLQHDVVVITINYRLEVLGFLCLDTPEVPGNAGMKDQVAALRWIQDNITEFGGDPNNVTICGESGGAGCVTYHMMSHMSDGLFHKGIAQSGVCIADWALGMSPIERAFRTGKVLGKETNNKSDLLNYLRNIPAEKLVKMTFKTMTYDEKHRGMQMHFVPVVEKEFNDTEAFLTGEPLDLLVSNKIKSLPLMIGYNSSEGIFCIPRHIKILDFMNKNLGFSVPREISIKVSEKKLNEFGERIRHHYVGNREYRTGDVVQLSKKYNGLHILYNTQRFAHFYSKICKEMYMYKFDYDTDLNSMKKMLGWSHLEGACHFDELNYLFSNDVNKDMYRNQQSLKECVNRVTKLWADFAKTGNPTPDDSFGIKWDPYTTANKECFIIDEVCSKENYPDRDEVEFWNQLYLESGLPSIK